MDAKMLLEFLRGHRYAVQTTVSANGGPQAALVGFAVTDEFEIVFDTLETTRKVVNLRHNGKHALVIGGWEVGDERTVQFEGVADEPTGAELERVKGAYFTAFPDGPARAKFPGITYVRIRPTWIRYSDYNVSPPEIVEFRAEDLRATRRE